MAQVTLFHHSPDHTAVHRLDARLKLPIAVLVAAAAASASSTGTLVVTAVVAAAFAVGRLSAGVFLRELKRFGPILAVIFAAALLRSFTASVTDEPAGLVPQAASAVPSLARTFRTLASGAVLGLENLFRFLLMIACGHVLTATTRISRIADAVRFYLSPIPFVPAAKAAQMLELMISFFPLLLDRSEEIREAELSRCGALKRGTAARMKRAVLPLVEAAAVLADELTDALASRCYHEHRTVESPPVPLRDLAVGLAIAVLLAAVAFRFV